MNVEASAETVTGSAVEQIDYTACETLLRKGLCVGFHSNAWSLWRLAIHGERVANYVVDRPCSCKTVLHVPNLWYCGAPQRGKIHTF